MSRVSRSGSQSHVQAPIGIPSGPFGGSLSGPLWVRVGSSSTSLVRWFAATRTRDTHSKRGIPVRWKQRRHQHRISSMRELSPAASPRFLLPSPWLHWCRNCAGNRLLLGSTTYSSLSLKRSNLSHMRHTDFRMHHWPHLAPLLFSPSLYTQQRPAVEEYLYLSCILMYCRFSWPRYESIA